MKIRGVFLPAVLVMAVALLLAQMTCTDRGTNPKREEPLIHEPWPDEEAELLALQMSGKLCAPRDLYERVQKDLTTIRQRWGDSIAIVKKLKYFAPHFPGVILLDVDGQVFEQMKRGEYAAWDSLNRFYGFSSVEFWDHGNFVYLHFGARLNPDALVSAYASLPGVFGISPDGARDGDGPTLYGCLHDTSPVYVFRDAWGDCPSGCIGSRYSYFRSDSAGISLVGTWSRHDSSGAVEPDWLGEVWDCLRQYYRDTSWTLVDTIPPARIVDLLAGNPTGHTITLSWTAPSDSAGVGHATGYDLRYAESPITGSWCQAVHVYGVPVPSSPGSPEHFVVGNLRSQTTYYFGIRAGDHSQNMSALSNIANAATLAIPGWTTFDETNSGFVGGKVRPITVDRDGSVWFGTSQGANRFDGVNWTTYTYTNSGLPDNQVEAIAIDSNGNVWFATELGAARYDGSRWTVYNTANSGIAKNGILSIAVDPFGIIWFGNSRGGCSRFDGSQWTNYDITGSGGRRWEAVWSIACGKNGDVWFATEFGAFKFNGAVWTSYTRANSGIPANGVRGAAAAPDGSIWFTFWPGYDEWLVARFDGINWVAYPGNDGEQGIGMVHSIAAEPDGVIWLASDQGAWRLDGAERTQYTTGNSGLASNNVLSVAVDKRGDWWFGTANSVCRYSRQSEVQ